MTLAIIIFVVALAIFAFAVCARSDWNKKDRLLRVNGYFLGRQIDEVAASIGIVVKKHPRWPGRIDYIWGYGNSSVRLVCDENNKIVDYCPSRQPVEAVLHYFEKNKDALMGVALWDIKKMSENRIIAACLISAKLRTHGKFQSRKLSKSGQKMGFAQKWSSSESPRMRLWTRPAFEED